MFKLIRKIIFLGILIVIFLAGKNYAAKFAIEKGVESATGLDLQLKSCSIAIKETSFGLEGIRLLNPEGFPDKYMFEAPEVFVNYTISPLFKKQIHLEELRLNLENLLIVRNKEGKLNLNALLPKAKAQDKSKEQKPDQEPKKKGKPFDLKVDKLLLRINKIVYKDYSKGSEPEVKELNIEIYETFKNIEGTEELISMIIQRALLRAALPNIPTVDLGAAKDSAVKSISNMFKFSSEEKPAGEQ